MSDEANAFVEVDRSPDGEWEVFVREAAEEPLVHVGSVTAEDAEGAREQADALFEECVALWLCPAAAVTRYADTALTPGETA